MSELKYGDNVLDVNDIPLNVQLALMARGFTHVLGNEVASKVTAKAKKSAEDKEAPRTLTEDEKTALAVGFRNAAIESIMDGSFGTHTRASGPKVGKLERIMRAFAVERLAIALAKSKAKLPTKTATIKVSGEDLTRDQLIDRWLAKHGDEAKAEAERRIAASEVDVDLDI